MRGMLSYVSLVPEAESPEAEYSRAPAEAAGAVPHSLFSVWHRAGFHVLRLLVSTCGCGRYCLQISQTHVYSRSFRHKLLRALVQIYQVRGGVGWGGGVAPGDPVHTHA